MCGAGVVFCSDLSVFFVGFGELEAGVGVFPFKVFFSVAGAVFGVNYCIRCGRYGRGFGFLCESG